MSLLHRFWKQRKLNWSPNLNLNPNPNSELESCFKIPFKVSHSFQCFSSPELKLKARDWRLKAGSWRIADGWWSEMKCYQPVRGYLVVLPNLSVYELLSINAFAVRAREWDCFVVSCWYCIGQHCNTTTLPLPVFSPKESSQIQSIAKLALWIVRAPL